MHDTPGVETDSTRRRLFAGMALAATGLGGAALLRPDAADAAGLPQYIVTASPFGAAGDGSTDDTSAIQAALDAAEANGGGSVYFPPGQYITRKLSLASHVHMRGAGVGATRLTLKSGQNTDLIQTKAYATPTEQVKFGIYDMTVDGNRTGNTTGTTTAGLRLYGRGFFVQNVEVTECRGSGISSEYDGGGYDMEAFLDSFRVQYCNGDGLNWQGPHDSVLTNFQVESCSGTNGVYVAEGGNSALFVNGHVWGDYAYAWNLQTNTNLVNCVAESGRTAQIWINSPDVALVGCIIGGDETTSAGLKLASDTTYVSRLAIDVRIAPCPTAILTASGRVLSSWIRATIEKKLSPAGSVVSGTFGDSNTVLLSVDDGTFAPAASSVSFGADARFRGGLTADGATALNGSLAVAGNVGFYGSAPVARSTGWSATGLTATKSLNATSSTADVRAVLGTLITTLKANGLIA